MGNTVTLELTVTDTHITLSRTAPDVVLASALLEVVRNNPACWRELCGAAVAAVAFEVTKTPAR